jgi:hypothetical protein
MIQGSIFIQDKEGKPLIYTVVRGNPAHLVAFQGRKSGIDTGSSAARNRWRLGHGISF